MSRNTKIILGGVAGVLLLVCLVGCVAGFFLWRSLSQVIVTDPDKVAAITGEIVEYKLPPGYNDQLGVKIAGFSVAVFNHSDGHSHIILGQFPADAELSQEEMEKQLKEAIRYQETGKGGEPGMKIVGQTRVTIRDQETTLTISEGTSSDGQSYRQVSGVFQGKGGPAMVMIMGPIDEWNQAGVDAFIASIH
jgi:hypothetical protein